MWNGGGEVFSLAATNLKGAFSEKDPEMNSRFRHDCVGVCRPLLTLPPKPGRDLQIKKKVPPLLLKTYMHHIQQPECSVPGISA